MASRGLWTIILIRSVGKRTFTFRFRWAWLWIIPALFTAVVLYMGFELRAAIEENEILRHELVEIDDLRRQTRMQQAEIDEMIIKTMRTQEKMAQLEELQAAIRSLTSDEDDELSATEEETAVVTLNGRGGPQLDLTGESYLPSVSSLLPPHLNAIIFGTRDTLPMDLKISRRADTTGGMALERARQTNILLDQQLMAMDEWAEVLANDRETIAFRLDYLENRPAGMPVLGASPTDRFGWRWSPFGWGQQFHNGIDLAANYWEPIYATAKGVVTEAGWKVGGFGYTVVIEHGHGFKTLYAHMSDWNVEVGDEVQRGDLIGWVGSTGASTGPHLHYEVHHDGIPVDPAKYLQ